jgi:hypothetical protein
MIVLAVAIVGALAWGVIQERTWLSALLAGKCSGQYALSWPECTP